MALQMSVYLLAAAVFTKQIKMSEKSAQDQDQLRIGSNRYSQKQDQVR